MFCSPGMRSVTKPQERLARRNESQRLAPSCLDLCKAKCVVRHRVVVDLVIVVYAVPRNAYFGAARNMRPVRQLDTLLRDDQLHDAALDEAVEAQTLAKRRVDVCQARQAGFGPARGARLAHDLLAESGQRRRAAGRGRDVEEAVRQGDDGGLDRGEAEDREAAGDHAGVELCCTEDGSGERVDDRPLYVIVLSSR